MSIELTRRDFVNAAVAGAVGVAGVGVGGCERILKQIRNRPVRRSLASLDLTSPVIEAYRDAVAAMKALSATDPRNWSRQASIHLNFCPHGNWFFLPWHRAYLGYFEQICRALINQPDFALPYWDWSATPSVPAPFWGGPTNPLFHSPRAAAASSLILPGITDRPTLDSILAETNFQVFASYAAPTQRPPSGGGYGRLEATPHNFVHGFVGGTMGTYSSPLDPVFWTHHNMIECLWVEWNALGNANTADAAWNNYTFQDNFVDGNGNPISPSVALVNLLPVLSYQFDGLCGGEAHAEARRRLQADTAAFRRILTATAPSDIVTRQRFPAPPTRVVAGRPGQIQVPVEPAAVDRFLQAGVGDRLLLTIGGIVPAPPSGNTFVRVFVGGTEPPRAMGIDDPHYAGSFAFFTDPDHTVDAPYIVDVSDAVRRLASQAALPARDRVTFHLAAVPFPDRQPSAEALAFQRIELSVAAVSTSQ